VVKIETFSSKCRSDQTEIPTETGSCDWNWQLVACQLLVGVDGTVTVTVTVELWIHGIWQSGHSAEGALRACEYVS